VKLGLRNFCSHMDKDIILAVLAILWILANIAGLMLQLIFHVFSN